MNVSELLNLNFQQAVQQFGDKRQTFGIGDVVGYHGYSGKDEGNWDFKGTHHLILAVISEINEEEHKIAVENKVKCFEKGGTIPHDGTAFLEMRIFQTTISEHIEESKKLGMN
jgi:hypothetical protein